MRRRSAKGLVSSVFVGLGVLAMTGCGPGLSHRAYGADDVLAAMNAELASAIPGNATLTSGVLELPETRMPVSEGGAKKAENQDEASAPQTWGSKVPQYDGVRSIYEP